MLLETAIEIVLPFVQVRLADVRIVPILLSWSDWPPTRELSHAMGGEVSAREGANGGTRFEVRMPRRTA